VRRWLEKCESCEGYRKAVERTGYTLFRRRARCKGLAVGSGKYGRKTRVELKY
jgi:hypothetical protein